MVVFKNWKKTQKFVKIKLYPVRNLGQYIQILLSINFKFLTGYMKKRVFIAINLPSVVREELSKLLAQLKKINSQPVIRYVKTKGIHLTLHFLGYLDEQQINQVKELMKDLARDYFQTSLTTNRINAFPNLQNPRVIFLSCQEERKDTLSNLQEDLGQGLERIGIKLDQRIWHPHLTLARIVGPTKFKTEQIKLPILKIPVNSIELMESQLLPQGAEYKILESYTLKS